MEPSGAAITTATKRLSENNHGDAKYSGTKKEMEPSGTPITTATKRLSENKYFSRRPHAKLTNSSSDLNAGVSQSRKPSRRRD
jgi:hypothetical protein